jgi:hypothetical protein
MTRSKSGVTASASRRTTAASPSPVAPNAPTKSASSSPRNSSSSGNGSTRSLAQKSRFPTGLFDAGDSPRERLLLAAGYTEEQLAKLADLSMRKATQMLEATETQYYAHQGTVTDERTQPALRVQLEAARTLTEVLGLKAPPAKQTVTVVHTLELPDWMQPDQPIDVTPTEEPPTCRATRLVDDVLVSVRLDP